MVATFRTRSRSRRQANGGKALALKAGITDSIQSDINLSETMNDWVGNPFGVNPFNLTTVAPAIGVVNGMTSTYWNCQSYIHTNANWNFQAYGSLISDSQAITKAMAGTNPSRPEVDIPVFLLEFRDIPRMLQHAHSRVMDIGHFAKGDVSKFWKSPKRFADDTLTNEYGWRPLLSDITKMVLFTEAVDRRVNELNRLNSGKGLRRKYVVDRGISSESNWIQYLGPSYQATARVRLYRRTKATKWISLVWRPEVTTSFGSDDDTRNLALRLVLGGYISPATLWEAMPWSWFIDWFTNFGEFLGARRNRVPVYPTDICSMVMTDTHIHKFEWVSNPYGCTFALIPGGGRVVKSRTTGFTIPHLPEFHLPFLNGRQWSILTALLTLRMR